jgi:hypothetical protein
LFDRLDLGGVTRRDVFHGVPAFSLRNFVGITILLL